MSFEEHLDGFAGLPVADFPITADGPLPQPPPGGAAWRIAVADRRTWYLSSRRYAEITAQQPRPPAGSPLAGLLEHGDQPGSFRELFAAWLARVPGDSVQALVIGATTEGGYDPQPAVELLIAAAPQLPNLRALFLGDVIREDSDVAYMALPPLNPLLAAFPALARLHVRGSAPWEGRGAGRAVVLEPFRHERLRTLVFESGGLSPDLVRAVGRSELPALAHLEFLLGDPEYGGGASAADLEPVLGGAALPQLRQLGLRDAPNADEIAIALSHAPIVAQLEVLDLSLGALGDEGATALLAGQPLGHLSQLDLHHHFIGHTLVRRLVEALPDVAVDVSDSQADAADGGYTPPAERYIAVSE